MLSLLLSTKSSTCFCDGQEGAKINNSALSVDQLWQHPFKTMVYYRHTIIVCLLLAVFMFQLRCHQLNSIDTTLWMWDGKQKYEHNHRERRNTHALVWTALGGIDGAPCDPIILKPYQLDGNTRSTWQHCQAWKRQALQTQVNFLGYNGWIQR